MISERSRVHQGEKMEKKDVVLKNVIEESDITSFDDLTAMIPEDEKSFHIRKMYIAAFFSLLMAVTMGLAVGYSAPATYDMTQRNNSPVNPSKSEISWVGSILPLGAMIGGIVAGPLADKKGRKDTLVFNVITYVVGWLLICYAQSIYIIIAGRFICGIACGIVSVTVPMYCVEISTSDVRGLLGSSFQGFMVIGNLLSAIIGSYVTWEYLALTGAIFSAIALICFIPMPESPRWLLAKGNMAHAIYVMQTLQGSFLNAAEECRTIYQDLEHQPKGMLSLRECKHPTVYKPAFLCVALMFFQQFSGANAVLFNSSSIFKVAKDFMDPKKATIILAAVQVAATLLSNSLVDKAGRKLLLQLSSAFMALSLIVLGIYYYISTGDNYFKVTFSWIPLLSLTLFVIAFSIGYGPIPWLLAAEMVPVRARSTIGGLATLANGLFAFTVTKTFSEMEDLICTHGTFWTYSALTIIGLIFVSFMLPETKGKKLEDIANIFYKPKNQKMTISISTIS